MINKKIKILYLLPSFKKASPTLGILALIKYMDKEKCDIVFSSLDDINEEKSYIVNELQKLKIPMKCFSLNGWTGLFRKNEIKKYIDDEEFDIVQSYGLRPDIINSLIKNKGLSFSSVREIQISNYNLQYGQIISRFFFYLHLKALKKMDHIISISNEIKTYLIKNGFKEEKIECILNSIDPNWTDTPAYLNEEIIKDEKVFNVGYFGNLINLKQVDWIINAIIEISLENPGLKIQLHLVGDGPLKNKLIQISNNSKIKDNIIFYGYLENISEIIKKMNLIVLTSKSEGIPRIFMEAMSLGKTCVGPDIGGITELIKDNETGYLFNKDSFIGFKRKLENIIKNNKILNPVKIKENIINNFCANKTAFKTLQLYEKILSAKNINNLY